jgi:hypothetical protein
MKSTDLINRICILVDGAYIDKFTVNEFLHIFNQNFFYQKFQPKIPNDIGLFKLWSEFLTKEGVNILTNSTVSKISMNDKNKIITYVKPDGSINTLSTDKVIFALPPKHIVNILKNSNEIKNCFMDFDKLHSYAEKTAYIEYIGITFHWNKKIILTEKPTFPSNEWGLISILSSKYTEFLETDPKTVISTSIPILNEPSLFLKKTANQCNRNELINETFRQLNVIYDGVLPQPDFMILNPNVYYDKTWKTKDTAFISVNTEFIDFESNISGIYNCGGQNGYQELKFTTMESSIRNAVILSQRLSGKDKYPLKEPFTFVNFIRNFVIVIVIIILYLYF